MRKLLHKQVEHARQVSQQKTTTGGQQLYNAITLSKYNPNFGHHMSVDSFAYTWSGNRELAHYPNPIYILTEPIYSEYAIPNAPEVEDPLLLMQADSVLCYQLRLPATDTERIARYAFDYDATNRVVGKHSLFSPNTDFGQDVHDEFTYDANGRLIAFVSYFDTDSGPGLTLDEYRSVHTTYNSNGSIKQDSIMYSGVQKVMKYYYQDIAGRDTAEEIYDTYQGSPVLDNSSVYTYDNSGRMLQRKRNWFDISSGILTAQWADSFSYNGFAFPIFHELSYTNVGSGSTFISQQFYTLNAQGDVVDDLLLNYNSQTQTMDSVSRSHTYYNANTNPDSVVVDEYYNGAWKNRSMLNYFRYEPTAIKEVAAKPVSIGLYPNPAMGVVHFSIPSFKNGTRSTASIYDMQGRLVMMSSIMKAEQAISVSGLPAGMYMVQYRGKDGSVGTARFVKE